MRLIKRDDGFALGSTESSKYLGSPDVVSKLIDNFCNDVYGWVKSRGDGSMTATAVTEILTDRINVISDIFMGRDDEYIGVMGWNNRYGLGLCIKQCLGAFWDKYKDSYDNDPGKAQFGWLAASIVDAALASMTDPDLAGASIQAKKAQVVKVLLGLSDRKG